LLALSLAVTTLASPPVQAATNTVSILTNTLSALPSCVSYQLRGVCFWLRCIPFVGCSIQTSIRVSHYVPDVIISTYHDPATHPWAEVGKPISVALSSVGSMLIGAPIDSSASTQKETAEIATFKSADAIANPAGMIAQVLSSNQMSNFSGSFGFPGFDELMAFPSTLPSIASQWAQVPQALGNELLESARRVAQMPSEILSSIAKFPSMLGNLSSSMGKLGDLFGGNMDLGGLTDKLGVQVSDLTSVDTGPIKDLLNVAQGMGSSGSFSDMFCPGSASAFTLHFQADMDALFWRSVIPVELLYPQSWVPGLGEVSTSPLVNTWGPTYPRTGELVQSHPVKASAVLATRVGNIITQGAQPHIYKRLVPGSGYRYFGGLNTRWQMLYPVAEKSCHVFGTNDSLGLTSYGDGMTDSADGYMWNMWNQYDCCRTRGIFLFSVP
jgi:hypothetical protein